MSIEFLKEDGIRSYDNMARERLNDFEMDTFFMPSQSIASFGIKARAKKIWAELHGK